MRVEECVGGRVREYRERLGITQQELGRRLDPLIGKTWSRQAVSQAEAGQRAFTAAELYALAAILETQPARLITPPPWVDSIEMPTGSIVQPHDANDQPQADGLVPEARAAFDELRRRHREQLEAKVREISRLLLDE